MRFPSLIALTLVLVTATTTAATGGTERRSVIPACEELLSKHEAALAMHQPTAEILSRSVVGSTRRCAYAAFFRRVGAVHSLELGWAHTLQVGCTDNKTADPMCARRAAMWSYDSVP